MINKLYKQINHLLIRPFKEWKKNSLEYNYIKKLFKSVKRESTINKTIVFNSDRAKKLRLDFDLFFGKLLALKGAKVKILIDDGVLLHWDAYRLDNLNYFKKDLYLKQKRKPINSDPFHFRNNRRTEILNYLSRRYIIKKILKSFKDKNIEYIFYSNMIKDLHIDMSYLKKFKNYALTSTIRFFSTVDLDFNSPDVKYYYGLSLKNAAISEHIGKYTLNVIKPDVFITDLGIYSARGTIRDYLDANGVKCLVSTLYTYNDNAQYVFFTNVKAQILSRDDFWKQYQNIPISEKMINALKDYFKERLIGNIYDVRELYNMEKNAFLEVEKEDSYKYNIAIFSNILADGAIIERNHPFNDPIDWILSTIRHLKNHKEIKVFLKIHPGENYWLKGTPGVESIIRKYFDVSQMRNLTIISAEDRINTYKFLNSGIDLVIVFDGFLGLEAPYLKIPTIVCANGGFSGVKDGNILIESKEEYFKLLDNLEKTIKDFHENYKNKYYKNIIRYLYWFLFENTFKVPILKSNEYKTDLFHLKKADLVLNEKFLKRLGIN